VAWSWPVIYIANDAGSAELSPLFANKVPHSLIEMKSADFCFAGHGPPDPTGHDLITVGIERKTLGDLIASMHSGRLMAKQIPRMLETYEYSYLLVEGSYRCNPGTGLIEEYTKLGWTPPRGGGKKGLSYAAIDHFLTSITLRTPVRLVRTSSYHQTVEAVISLYHYFQTRWDQHGSWKTFHSPGPPMAITSQPRENDSTDGEWEKWVLRLVAKELPGIGWERSLAVTEVFANARQAIMADPREWQAVKGVGAGIAGRVARALGKMKGER